MLSRTPGSAAASLLAVGLAGLLPGCSGDDSGGEDTEKKAPAPAGIVSTKQARAVPLDITRERFDSLVRQRPVRVKKRRTPREEAKLAKLRPAARKILQEKFGKAKDGTVTIPPQTLTCLLYRGEDPKRFGWQFCFGEAGRLEAVSTAPPL